MICKLLKAVLTAVAGSMRVTNDNSQRPLVINVYPSASKPEPSARYVAEVLEDYRRKGGRRIF